MSKYPNTLGRIEAVWNKLGGEDGVDRFLRGELVVAVPNPPEFDVWKTIKLGTSLKTADEFRKALSGAGYRIGNWSNDILGKPAFRVSESEMDVDLVNVSVVDLGFKDGAYCRYIIERALSSGLQLCPAEVGPQLRLQYADQPEGEWLLVGMEPINDSDALEDLGVFLVGHRDGERWLHSNHGYPDGFRGADDRFVFVRPRK